MQNNVRKLRGQAGLSQIELAKLIGVTRYTIIQLEASDNEKVITKRLADKLCEVFNCSLIELYGMSIFRIPLETEEDKMKVIEMLNRGK
jgi:DNA-binding XRE family transcriptional regulator